MHRVISSAELLDKASDCCSSAEEYDRFKAVIRQTSTVPETIAMSVKRSKDGLYRCPACGYKICQIPAISQYCTRCGQKLSWDKVYYL